ncbi:MAG: hypothetical protein ACJA2X_000030 [Halocynthiibacter sp.]|jgi:hypothetical protein
MKDASNVSTSFEVTLDGSETSTETSHIDLECAGITGDSILDQMLTLILPADYALPLVNVLPSMGGSDEIHT